MKLANKVSIGALVVIAVCIMTMPKVNAAEFDIKSFLDNVHVRIGVAKKLHETRVYVDHVLVEDALTARLALFYRFNDVLFKGDSLDLGADHHSQYSENAPFNDRGEYAKTEIFVDYTFSLGSLL